jgi:type IV pilus assembly protein PilZ
MAEGRSEGPPGEDRRGQDRAPVTLRVDYKRLNTFFADYTKNISKGGTFIRTASPLAVGTEFVFVLTVPEPSLDHAPIRLELAGRVKWIVNEAEATLDKPAGMGIQFLFRDDTERHRVESFVADLMRTSLGEIIADNFLARARGREEG